MILAVSLKRNKACWGIHRSPGANGESGQGVDERQEIARRLAQIQAEMQMRDALGHRRLHDNIANHPALLQAALRRHGIIEPLAAHPARNSPARPPRAQEHAQQAHKRVQQQVQEGPANIPRQHPPQGSVQGNNMANANALNPNQPRPPAHNPRNPRNDNIFAPLHIAADANLLMQGRQGVGRVGRLEAIQRIREELRQNVYRNLHFGNHPPNLAGLAQLQGAMRPAARSRDGQAAHVANQAQANQMRDARA